MSLVLTMETLDRELITAAVWAGAVPCVLAVWRWYVKPRD